MEGLAGLHSLTQAATPMLPTHSSVMRCLMASRVVLGNSLFEGSTMVEQISNLTTNDGSRRRTVLAYRAYAARGYVCVWTSVVPMITPCSPPHARLRTYPPTSHRRVFAGSRGPSPNQAWRSRGGAGQAPWGGAAISCRLSVSMIAVHSAMVPKARHTM
jgi:hypothetical protein